MQHYNNDQKLAEFLENYKGQIRIAPLAMNIHVLLQALSDDDMDSRQLSAVLHHYPVITARLIALANSAWASPATPITSIEAACTRLGNSVVKGVSIALAVASSFNTARCPNFDQIRFWSSSMLVSEGARLLVDKLPKQVHVAADLTFTAQTGGVLHNLGLLWLADNLPLETAEALRRSAQNPDSTVSEVLAECVGIDYCLVGAWIARRWQIPEELLVVMQHHRTADYHGVAETLVEIVGAAAKMVSALFHGLPEVQEQQVLSKLGIDQRQQAGIFTHLIKQFPSIQDLAKALFL